MAIDVASEITGSVWKILVEIGDPVSRDDTLVVLESMKMEIPLVAPFDGVVVAIAVAEGEAVNEGQVVVRLDRRG